MLRSMTAFGRFESESEFGVLAWELRSVNHRYLDVSIRLPDELRTIESELRKRLTNAVNRGKVEASLRLLATSQDAPALQVNDALLKTVASAANAAAKLAEESTVIDPLRLLQWPGVLTQKEGSVEALAAAALLAFDSALSDFVATREREGELTSSLLTERLEKITEQVVHVRQLRPAVVARQKERLQAKLAELDTEHDAGRVEQELVYLAQRLDIDEELDRLENHIVEMGKVLKRQEPVGRRLDFLMQEFNREANTLGSKANDSDTTGASVEIKVLIEQMREQIQNIE